MRKICATCKRGFKSLAGRSEICDSCKIEILINQRDEKKAKDKAKEEKERPQERSEEKEEIIN